MKVSELAEELDVAPSMILDQCQRFGIDASWAEAELGGADLVILRAELANSEPIDLTLADPAAPQASVPVGATGTTEGGTDPASLPPTAVGSIPGLVDQPDPTSAEPEEPPRPAPGFGLGRPQFAAETSTRPPGADGDGPAPARKLDRSARTGLIALVIAFLAFVASNVVGLAVWVGVLWFIAAVSLVIAVYDSFRGRRQAQLHPDRKSGLGLATTTMVLAIGGIIAMTALIVTTIGDDPAAGAPLGIGELKSVQLARWGYQRTMRLADNGWHQPARPVDSCWSIDEAKKARDEDRVELPDLSDMVGCKKLHDAEVGLVFAYDRDADSTYPGTDGFVVAAQDTCGSMIEKAQRKVPDAELKVEYPTESGWGDGDHDVACLIVTEPRGGRLS